jgi:hypothetical protein
MNSETREVIRRETKNVVASGGKSRGIGSASYIQVCISSPVAFYNYHENALKTMVFF